MINLKMSFMQTSFVICAVSLGTLLSGCGGPGQTGASTASKHAHLKLHMPKSLDGAVERLSAIHAAVTGEGELPAPSTFEYVEVIHGQGPSAHSHFYLADNYDSVMEHDEEDEHHEDEHEEIQRHTAEVDFRAEFADVVRWLPDIAAKTDLKSAAWQSVSDVSKKLTGVLESMPADVADAALRDSWKKKSNEIGDLLNQLVETIASAAGEDK